MPSTNLVLIAIVAVLVIVAQVFVDRSEVTDVFEKFEEFKRKFGA
jgi:hypothetical protein